MITSHHIAGVELFDSGAPQADAPVLVFLHGAGVDADLWEPQVAALAGSYRVICVNLPGHGGSAMVLGGVPGMADAVHRAVMVHVGGAAAQGCCVVGLSLGGMVALEMAARWPQAYTRLVMAESVPHVSSSPVLHCVARVGIAVMARLNPWLTTLMPSRAMGAETEAAGRYVKQAVAKMGRAEISAVMQAALEYDGRPHLAHLTMPVLVMVGEKNPQTHTRARAMASAIQGARLLTLSNAGHIANRDAPEIFNKTLVEFLKEPA